MALNHNENRYLLSFILKIISIIFYYWYYAFTKNGTKNILTIDFDDGDIMRFSIANQSGSNFYFY